MSITKSEMKGVVYAWGTNHQGQIGVEYEANTLGFSVQPEYGGGPGAGDLKYPFPRMVVALKEEVVTEIACGHQHTLAVTVRGQLFAWGSNDSG